MLSLIVPVTTYSWSLLLVCLGGCAAGGLVNWAIYRLAWHPRDISPWGPTPPQAPPRRPTDRLPVWGWLGLRREAAIHGRGFWIRPLLIELTLGLGLAALYGWEVQQQSLVLPQVSRFFSAPLPAVFQVVSTGLTLPMCCVHAVLILLMLAASFIDIDEKIIPDEITVPGTLLGLLLATLCPLTLLPHVASRSQPPLLGQAITVPPAPAPHLSPGKQLYSEAMTLAAPNPWPPQLGGASSSPSWTGLICAQACWWLWCCALMPRVWRGRHGPGRALGLIARRVLRELSRPPWAQIAGGGSLAVAGVWWYGGTAWLGLLTALVGMAATGGLIWMVRLIGTAALGREAMGFGDVTLMMMVGSFMGWQAGVVIFFVAPFAGLVLGLLQLVLRREDAIPYGPFLCLGTLLVIVRWPSIWNPGLQALFSVPWLVPGVLLVCFTLLGVMLTIWQQIKQRLFSRS